MKISRRYSEPKEPMEEVAESFDEPLKYNETISNITLLSKTDNKTALTTETRSREKREFKGSCKLNYCN